MFIANVTSLEIQVTSYLTPFATSAFQFHSLVSTIAVVQGIVSGQLRISVGILHIFILILTSHSCH